MPDPIYYTGDNVNRRVEAKLDGAAHNISAATIDVWNPAGAKIVDAQAMTIATSKATYQISGGVILTAGTYKVEYKVTFASSQGQLSLQETFVVKARFP